ncbi:MAG TPA: DUF6448 family protein [Gemmatimonadales bacterium]
MSGLKPSAPLSRSFRRVPAILAMALAMTALGASEALAHCDTMDGPVVTAARRALDSGSLEPVLIWVRPQDEREIRSVYEHTRSVRKLGAEARELADRYFFETVVRVHREGEGEPYTGLKPAGTDHGPAVPAADRALASGDVTELEAVVLHAVRDGLRERFRHAVAARGFADGDVEAGRAYVAAYVPLLHYVEQLYGLTSGEAHPHGTRPAAPHAAAGHGH